MSEVFVQLGSGVVRLQDVIAQKEKAFWRQDELQTIADVHEEKFPGVTVRRPWESEAEHNERLARRKIAAVAETGPTINGDPARIKHELERYRLQLAGIGVDHPQYDKLFDTLTGEIRMMETALNLPLTDYPRGKAIKKKEITASKESIDKLGSFLRSKEPIRKALIEKCEDLELMTLIRDYEEDPKLKTMAVQRVEQLKAVTA